MIFFVIKFSLFYYLSAKMTSIENYTKLVTAMFNYCAGGITVHKI